ncbi:hypothetical protein B566_EDAN013435 [Ephemera danica]|nr:hypothetical protein B566_EDAN013435 [Ephemera danica]
MRVREAAVTGLKTVSLLSILSIGIWRYVVFHRYNEFCTGFTQVTSVIIILVGLTRIVFESMNYRLRNEDADGRQRYRRIYQAAMFALLIVQLYLGVCEFLNHDEIHDDIWDTMINLDYFYNQRDWDFFNCCGVYGTIKLDKNSFPCFEEEKIKKGCLNPLINHLDSETTIIGRMMIYFTFCQLIQII